MAVLKRLTGRARKKARLSMPIEKWQKYLESEREYKKIVNFRLKLHMAIERIKEMKERRIERALQRKKISDYVRK